MQRATVGFLPRLGAFIVDIIAIEIGGVLFGIVFGVVLGAFGVSGLVVQHIYDFVWLLYFPLMWGLVGATIGNMAFRQVIQGEDGRRTGILRGYLRYLVFLMSIGCLLIGVLWPLWDKERRGWHDYAANTWVVRESRPETVTISDVGTTGDRA